MTDPAASEVELNDTLRRELPNALASGQLIPFFQPEVQISSGNLVGVEALVRWEHPEYGLLAPSQFLPLVEELGLSESLNNLMLDRALHYHRRWAEAGWTVPVSVNIGPDCIADPRFSDQVADVLALHHVAGRMLTLEITEQSASAPDPGNSLIKLRELGVGLALDDFGTGFSSLERLGDQPVQMIKLDISLVRPLAENPSFRKIAELTIELAHQLDIQVVAEGVETAAVRHQLASLGCDFAQGYLYARPMPPAELFAWLAAAHKGKDRRAELRGSTSLGIRVDHATAEPTPHWWRSIAAAPAAFIEKVGMPSLIFALVMLTVYGLWQLFRWGGHQHQALIGDLAFVPVNGAAVVAVFKVSSRKSEGVRTCRAWRLLGIALTFYLLGDLLQFVYEVVLHQKAYPSWADAAYLCFYFVTLAGLLTFPTRRRARGERFRLFLDMATVFVGGASVIWYVALGPAVSAQGGFNLANIVTFAYPVGDLVLFFGVVSLLARGVRRSSVTALKIFAVGMLMFVAADMSYTYVTLHSTYIGGDPVDSLWIVALMVMFLAASAQWRSTLQPELTKAAPQQQPMSRPSITPYIAVAVSYFLLIQAGRHVVFDPLGGLILGAVVITSLVSVRQLTALRDNRELAIGYRALADIDGLTGLYNRRRFMDLAEEVFAHAHRLDLPLAAMMIDIDHFKQINDQFGHMCGDQVISGIARFCQERLRPDDIAGRYGGDELIILLPGTSSEAAVHLAERLSERNGEVTKLGASAMPFTISIGIADVTGCRDTAALLARADLALYEAKRAGRACWRVYEEIDPSARAPVEAIVGVE